MADASRLNKRLSIVIPTYQRDQVLVRTLEQLLALPVRADELVVVDQTEKHSDEAEQRLKALAREGQILWLRLQQPSIPAAMNIGLLAAGGDSVLFLDDDIAPHADLVHAHVHALKHRACVAGMVIQPWTVRDAPPEQANKFERREAISIDEFMGGNFSIRRKIALAIGGFDENFRGAAYCFEKEFADRLRSRGYDIWYEPTAIIEHLKEATGGTRSFGSHLTTIKPHHAVGAHYYLLRSTLVRQRLRRIAHRILRSVFTRHHVRYPWWIPVTLLSELLAVSWAAWLGARGPKLIRRAVK